MFLFFQDGHNPQIATSLGFLLFRQSVVHHTAAAALAGEQCGGKSI